MNSSDAHITGPGFPSHCVERVCLFRVWLNVCPYVRLLVFDCFCCFALVSLSLSRLFLIVFVLFCFVLLAFVCFCRRFVCLFACVFVCLCVCSSFLCVCVAVSICLRACIFCF